jgi:hypothetical protein
MSRSIKKTPSHTCGYGSKSRRYFKRCSSKRTRKDYNVIDGSMYKKNDYSWSICDYKTIYFRRIDWMWMHRWYDYNTSSLLAYKDLSCYSRKTYRAYVK